MWKATNKTTGKEYTLTDEQKAFYERDPNLTGKYRFSRVVEPRPVAGAATKKEADEPQKKTTTKKKSE